MVSVGLGGWTLETFNFKTFKVLVRKKTEKLFYCCCHIKILLKFVNRKNESSLKMTIEQKILIFYIFCGYLLQQILLILILILQLNEMICITRRN